MGDKLEIEYISTQTFPVFGGMKIQAHYVMFHRKNGYNNRYNVLCEVLGLPTADPHLDVESAEWIVDGDTNPETLTQDGARQVFEENFL